MKKFVSLLFAISACCGYAEIQKEPVSREILQASVLQKDIVQLTEFAKNGNLLARLMLIHLYTEGTVGEKNQKEAEKWMLEVSAQMHQLSSEDRAEKFKSEYKILENITTQYGSDNTYKGILGYMLLRGWGTEKNYDQAFKYVKESADLGNAFSNADLGKMYQEGLGTEKDYFEAYHRYRSAADNGLSVAYYRLGLMFDNGIGVEKNTKKAQELFQKADFIINKNNTISHTETLSKDWMIGGKIHFEEQGSANYIGTVEINELTRKTIKDFFDVQIDSCAHNAKALIKRANDQIILTHYEERAKPGIGEEMHATLLYTKKRVENGHETLRDIYENLRDADTSLPQDRAPTVEQVANAYQKIIKPDWKFQIVDVVFISGKTGSGVVAKLQLDGQDEISNNQGHPISGNFLHLTLAMIDASMTSEMEKIQLVASALKENLSGKMVKIGNRNGQADLEFGVSGSVDRIRPSSN